MIKLQELYESLIQVVEKSFWVKKQTALSMLSSLIGECYELVDAIQKGNCRECEEELGDVLGLAMMLCLFFEKDQSIDFQDLLERHLQKIKRRQPHIFDSEKALKIQSMEEAEEQWHRLKYQEKGKTERNKLLDGVPTMAPSLSMAYHVCNRMVEHGHEISTEETIPDLSEENLEDFLWSICVYAQKRNINLEYLLRKKIFMQTEKLGGKNTKESIDLK